MDGEEYMKKSVILSKLQFYLFCVKWLWNNRKWDNNRHKFKAMMREWGRRNV